MFPHLHIRFLIAGIGDQAAGKIQGIAILVGDHFYGIGVLVVFRLHFCFHGGHFQVGILLKGVGQVVDDLGRDHGFISLDVDDHVHILIVQGHFSQPVSTARMIRRGHDGPAAEGGHHIGDALIVGGHQDLVGNAGQRSTLIHTLDHRFALDQCQGFARQTGGTITGRNHT